MGNLLLCPKMTLLSSMNHLLPLWLNPAPLRSVASLLGLHGEHAHAALGGTSKNTLAFTHSPESPEGDKSALPLCLLNSGVTVQSDPSTRVSGVPDCVCSGVLLVPGRPAWTKTQHNNTE